MPTLTRQQKEAKRKKQRLQFERDERDEQNNIRASTIPNVENVQQRIDCRFDLLLFMQTYLRAVFFLAMSEDHVAFIKEVEQRILHGGCKAIAMPRGSGKTSILLVAALWALLYGHRRGLQFIAATDDKARGGIRALKVWLRLPTVRADFPEYCYAISHIDNKQERARFQQFEGISTGLEWKQTRLRLPMIPLDAIKKNYGRKRVILREMGLCEGSGALVTSYGITSSAIRGQMEASEDDGAIERVDFVLLDDVQSDSVARNPNSVQSYAGIIDQAVMLTAGPTTAPAAFFAGTIIADGDVPSQYLDRKKKPVWSGTRVAAMNDLPKNIEQWEEYRDIRASELEEGETATPKANSFYKKNQRKMDAGVKHYWQQRVRPNELSAIQGSMNVWCDSELTFWSELMNQPQSQSQQSNVATVEQICEKHSGYERNVVPAACTRLTSFIDCHDDVLYFAVVAFEENGSAYLIDYNTYPEQPSRHFEKRSAVKTTRQIYPNMETKARLLASLEAATEIILSNGYRREDGGVADIDRIGIDSGWQSDTVKRFCWRHSNRNLMLACKGMPITAKSRSLTAGKPQRGEAIGPRRHQVRVLPPSRGEPGRTVLHDPNHHKSSVHDGFVTPLGGTGCLALYDHRTRGHHQLLSEHCLAEEPIEVEANGNRKTEWRLTRAGRDNHYFDTLVGCYIVAIAHGLNPSGSSVESQRTPRREDSATATAMAALANGHASGSLIESYNSNT